MVKKEVLCLALAAICLFLIFSFVGAQPVEVRPLILDEQETKIWNMETMQSWTYAEFVSLSEEDRTFNAGEDFTFDIVLINTLGSSSIPPEYRINLYASLDNPVWTYRDTTKRDVGWIVWNTAVEHDIQKIEIKLNGEIPDPVWNVTEPHFEGMELQGLVQRELYIQINVTDGTQTIQELTKHLKLLATNEDLKNYVEETKNTGITNTSAKLNEAFDGSSNALSALSNLRERIIDLAEEGHPGWAYDLSQDLKSFDESMGRITVKECPVTTVEVTKPPSPFFIVIGLAIGIVGGVLAGRFTGGKKLGVPDLADQIKKVEDVRKRIQEIREDDTKRKIELIGPETELKEVSRRMESINSEFEKIREK